MVFSPQGATRGQKREGADRVKRTSSGEKRACGTGKIARGERKIVGEWRRAGSGGACRGVAACLRRGPGGESMRGAAMPRSHRQSAALVRAGEGGWHGRRGLRAGRAGGLSDGERAAHSENRRRAVPLPGRGVRGGRRRRTACLCRAHACVMRFSAAGPEEGSFFVRCRAEGLQISFPVLTGRREFRILKQRTVTL